MQALSSVPEDSAIELKKLPAVAKVVDVKGAFALSKRSSGVGRTCATGSVGENFKNVARLV